MKPLATLIIDSGGSKAAWAFSSGGLAMTEGAVRGIHPLLLDDEELLTAAEALARALPGQPEAVFYYGTGCSDAKPAGRVLQAFQLLFPQADIQVQGDILGAARGLWGQERGIALVLGTGSNVCLVDGGEILRNTGGLGYVLGDEGSGADLGKRLLSAFLNGLLPEDLRQQLTHAYTLDRGTVLDQVYRQPFANRYLASFAPFLHQNAAHPFVQALVAERFQALFRHNLIPLGAQAPLGCVGSVGFYFQSVLAAVARQHGFELARVVQTPMEGLIRYHLARR
jgi:N-acetylglucosamine kinase-like BadF-type ATPase